MPPRPPLPLLVLALVAAPVAAQQVAPGRDFTTLADGLPWYEPTNPLMQARSGLAFIPYVPAKPGLQVAIYTDYASATEQVRFTAQNRNLLLVDGEFLRLGARLTRDLSPRAFLLADVSVGGAYGGFLDGFLTWYHDLWGFPTPDRQRFQGGQFGFQVEPFGGGLVATAPTSGLHLNDVRLGAGWRLARGVQLVGSVTLPTSSAPTAAVAGPAAATAGTTARVYSRGTVSVNATLTGRTALTPRLLLEGSLGAGYTPATGALAAYQATTFASASAGGRWRFAGAFSAFTTFWWHSAPYRNTALAPLDDTDLSIDVGFLVRPRRGPEWTFALTEDLSPSGPAIDATFRVGARF
ncbi:MAG: DUF3187 family protein [Gemmatimonadales bacterium]|nr:DUF3187 family protein [Gemmatimonadales bacterium]